MLPKKHRSIIQFPAVVIFLLLVALQGNASSEDIVLRCPDEVIIGRPFRVSLSSVRKIDSVMIEWLDKILEPQVLLDENGSYFSEFIIGTGVSSDRIGKSLLKFYLSSEDDEAAFSWQIVVKGYDFPSESFSVSPEMVKPPSEVLSRIERERQLIFEALGSDSAVKFWEIPFVRPVDGSITSCYGKKRILNGVKSYRHSGVDLRAVAGTPVKAVAEGLVVLASDLYFGGKSVYLHHGNGLVSIYCHLSEILVNKGDHLQSGEVLGYSGSTGRVTGPHLHLGMSIKGDMVDPMPLFQGGFGAGTEYSLDVF